VLANPKVLALNKQRGEVHVGNEDGYITTTVTENAQTQSVQMFETGTKLIFRPYIGDDGYIRMEIHPEDSTGGVTLQGQQSLPHKTTTEVTTNVMVKDNHTIVIGGLFRETTTSFRNQVPGLGSLPLVGYAFRQHQDTKQRQEVIILLTPHIIKDQDAYARGSEDAQREFEKLRVGVRKGVMPWGREAMAESCYEAAVAEMAKDHPDQCKALWNLDMATNLNPKYLEAIDLKERITGKEVTSTDNSTIRRFVSNMVLADKASTENPPRVVPITPSTQPMSDAMPTTRPTVAEAPSTQPTVAMGPATQPSTQPAVADDDSATTQPAVADGETATTQPAVADGETPTSQPAVANSESPATQPVAQESAEDQAQAVEAPTSQPANAPSKPTGFTNVDVDDLNK
jgi:hypothetical protein